MKAKSILAVLASATTGFFLGWLIWGVMLAGFYEANMVKYDGLINPEPPIITYVITNLVNAILLLWVLYYLGGIRSAGKAFITGAILAFLTTLPFEIFFYTGMNLYSGAAILTDIILNTLMGGTMGGVAVLVMGSGKKDSSQ